MRQINDGAQDVDISSKLNGVEPNFGWKHDPVSTHRLYSAAHAHRTPAGMLKERVAILLMLSVGRGGHEYFDGFAYQKVAGITEKPFRFPVDELYETAPIHHEQGRGRCVDRELKALVRLDQFGGVTGDHKEQARLGLENSCPLEISIISI